MCDQCNRHGTCDDTERLFEQKNPHDFQLPVYYNMVFKLKCYYSVRLNNSEKIVPQNCLCCDYFLEIVLRYTFKVRLST